MRIKTLFSIPDGEKVTEKALRRVLISSICSILLCMTCLVSTTWAWFTVSVENIGNVIEIATVTADVNITKGEGEVSEADNGSYNLLEGAYTINIKLKTNASATNGLDDREIPVYVVMSVVHSEATQYYYCVVEGSHKEVTKQLTVDNGPAMVSFSVSWVEPVSALPIDTLSTVMIGEVPAELTTDQLVESTADVVENPSTEATTAAPAEPSDELSAGPSQE